MESTDSTEVQAIRFQTLEMLDSLGMAMNHVELATEMGRGDTFGPSLVCRDCSGRTALLSHPRENLRVIDFGTPNAWVEFFSGPGLAFCQRCARYVKACADAEEIQAVIQKAINRLQSAQELAKRIHELQAQNRGEDIHGNTTDSNGIHE